MRPFYGYIRDLISMSLWLSIRHCTSKFMKTSRNIAIALGLLLQIPSAFSDCIEFSAAFGKCITKAGAVDPEVLECIGDEFEVQDRRLNSSYKALIAKLDAPRRKQLQDAQKLWIKYVDANCNFYYDPNGGTSARMLSAHCLINARAERAGELEDLAKRN